MANHTAALLIIGNEILSGRTQDKNLNYLAKKCVEHGVTLAEVRVVRDDEGAIVTALNALREQCDYVFTTGGIGPTHDDITTACVAKAFGADVELNDEAMKLLEGHYSNEELNEARKKMAVIPVGATLIHNPVSAAPGFILGNVHVMAGVPRIFQAMLDSIIPGLAKGNQVFSHTISVNVTEGTIAMELGKIQESYRETEIGSYPFMRNGVLGTSIVIRSEKQALIDEVTEHAKALLARLDAHILEEF